MNASGIDSAARVLLGEFHVDESSPINPTVQRALLV